MQRDGCDVTPSWLHLWRPLRLSLFLTAQRPHRARSFHLYCVNSSLLLHQHAQSVNLSVNCLAPSGGGSDTDHQVAPGGCLQCCSPGGAARTSHQVEPLWHIPKLPWCRSQHWTAVCHSCAMSAKVVVMTEVGAACACRCVDVPVLAEKELQWLEKRQFIYYWYSHTASGWKWLTKLLLWEACEIIDWVSDLGLNRWLNCHYLRLCEIVLTVTYLQMRWKSLCSSFDQRFRLWCLPVCSYFWVWCHSGCILSAGFRSLCH